MDEPEAEEAFDLDFGFPKMNFSNDAEHTQIYSTHECLELFGNYSNIPSNIGCIDHAPVLNQSTVIKSLILSLMAILSLVGNAATMLSIKRSKRDRSAHIYTLIYHLSIADLFVTFWCILGEAIWLLTVEWKVGNIECKAFKFLQMFSLYLSTFIMVLIGVDRFIAVKYPLKSMRNGMCFRLIVLCWGISAVLSLPQMVIFHVKQGPFVEEFYQCVTYGFYTAEWQEHLYTVFTLVCGFILPLLILLATYILTVVTLHINEEILDHTGTFRTLIDPNRRKLLRRAKMKSLRISVAIVVTFIICWTPYYFMMITYLFFVPDKDKLINEDLYSGFFFFGMSNSVFNPLIYGIFHLWRPRRKELQRGISNKRSYFSFLRQRSSGTLINGSILSRIGNVDVGCGRNSQTDSHHTQHCQRHRHLHRNGTFGTSETNSSVRTMNASFNNKSTKDEELLNRINLQNSPVTNHNDNQHQNGIQSHAHPVNDAPPDSHICICKRNGVASGKGAEDHV